MPRFAIIDTARDADAKRAREVGAGIEDGEIVMFDRAYVDFEHLHDLEVRGVVWVTRAKENLQFEVVQAYPVKAGGKVVSDELVGLKNPTSQKAYPELMRRMVAWVEADGQERLMTFPILIRQLKDVLQEAKTKSKTLIILGCRLCLPPELEHGLTIVEFAPPGKEELRAVLGGIMESAGIKSMENEAREKVIDAA